MDKQTEDWVRKLELDSSQKTSKLSANFVDQELIFQSLKTYYETDPGSFCNMVSNGPPPAFRWISWRIIILSKSKKTESFEELAKKGSEDTKMKDSILKDIHRTFPNVGFFSNPEHTAHQALAEQLFAFGAYKPEVGYVQGINFIIAALMLISGKWDEEVFRVVQNLADENLDFFKFEAIF